MALILLARLGEGKQLPAPKKSLWQHFEWSPGTAWFSTVSKALSETLSRVLPDE